jgi:hypothetical protein
MWDRSIQALQSHAFTGVTANATGGTQTGNGLLALTYYTVIELQRTRGEDRDQRDTGLWRKLGVDANGNAVKTSLYGTQKAETDGFAPIITYKQYDERGLEIASYGADVDPGSADVRPSPAPPTTSRARSLTIIDAGNTNANARIFVYDDVGNQISSTDADSAHDHDVAQRLPAAYRTDRREGHPAQGLRQRHRALARGICQGDHDDSRDA